MTESDHGVSAGVNAPEPQAPAKELRFFALWAVFRRDPARPAGTASVDVAALEALGAAMAAERTLLRGFYDVSGLRADADVMLWLTGESAEALQAALRRVRRIRPFDTLLPVWNALGVHRTAEFNPRHAPAFAAGLAPKQWVTVYPFVRSYEWYFMPEDDRRRMLADHGRKGAEYPGVLANTVSAFALGDYEWILGLEADDLLELVDLMRHLRNTEARLHVREEVPFYTGRRVSPAELAEVLS